MDEDRPQRHNGRRSEDPEGLWRHPWFRKLVGSVVALLTPTAVYFWHESRTALSDIQISKADIIAVRYEVQKLKDEVVTNSQLSSEQRDDLKSDVSRVENKVDRIDERLSRWFERSSRPQQ